MAQNENPNWPFNTLKMALVVMKVFNSSFSIKI